MFEGGERSGEGESNIIWFITCVMVYTNVLLYIRSYFIHESQSETLLVTDFSSFYTTHGLKHNSAFLAALMSAFCLSTWYQQKG